MTDRLITFDTAVLAKEKGFNIPIIYGYASKSIVSENGELMSCFHYHDYGDISPFDYNNKTFRHYPNGCYSAPTQSLLQKWIRENSNLHIVINHFRNGTYTCVITEQTPIDSKIFGECWDTYEEALEVALQRALNLIN